MKIVSLTMIYNLEDVLELFVRHHVRCVDHMILIVHGNSTDSTETIAKRLQQEGLPITLEYCDIPTFAQSSILSEAAARAIQVHQPDLLLPIDCDEFLCAMPDTHIRDLLESLPTDCVSTAPWRTYVPKTEHTSLVHRMTHRRRAEAPAYAKVMIPKRFLTPSLIIHQGAHNISVDGMGVDSTPLHTLWLAHLPIRSPAQALEKALVAWPRQRDNPRHKAGEAFHWETLYNAALRDDSFSHDRTVELAACYACAQKDSCPALVADPLATYVFAPESTGR